jgi:hypothetical protein
MDKTLPPKAPRGEGTEESAAGLRGRCSGPVCTCVHRTSCLTCTDLLL